MPKQAIAYSNNISYTALDSDPNGLVAFTVHWGSRDPLSQHFSVTKPPTIDPVDRAKRAADAALESAERAAAEIESLTSPWHDPVSIQVRIPASKGNDNIVTRASTGALSRSQINDLIKTLRRARDAAYGADE